MVIERVDAVTIGRDLEERFANAQKWRDSRSYCLVRIEADDGTTGWGECWGPVAGNRELIEEFVAPFLVGRDPHAIEQIHDALSTKLRTAFHSFLPVSVLSGVDIALWDLKGKLMDVPIANLLGGQQRESVSAYATGHFWPDVETFEEISSSVVTEATENVDAGFEALKLKIGFGAHPDFPYGREEDIELVRAVREAVGDDVTLMVDANQAYDMADARWVGRRLADLDVFFFEEPFPATDIDGYSRLNEAIDVPLAGGESWALEPEFREVLDVGGVDYTQPDIASAGGITSTMRIAAATRQANRRCLPHVFGSAVALAASLQVLAVLPGEPLLEFDRTPNPFREDLPTTPIELEDSRVAIPEGPGIGIDIDQSTLDDYRL